jgi:hypothetical protein
MPFIIDNEIINHDFINYDYSQLLLESIYYKNISLNGYIHIPLKINKNNNFISSLNIPERFIPSSLYILNKSCEIQDISFDAELVLENISYTNSKKMYVRFPLKTKNTEHINIIDDIIKQTTANTKINLDLNKLLKHDQKCIFYEDPYLTKIVLFTEPIFINSDLSKINWNNENIPFQSISNTYVVLNAGKSIEKNTEKSVLKEGFDSSVMDCQLVDTADDEIATYTVPIDGDVSKLYTDMFNMKIVTDFIMFILIFASIYFFTPLLYDSLLITNITRNQNIDEYSRRKVLNYIESSIRYVFLIFAILLFTNGTTFQNTTETMVAAIILFLIFTCFFYIKYYKETNSEIKSWPEDIEGSSFPSGILNGYGRMILNMTNIDTMDHTIIAFVIILLFIDFILYPITNTINADTFVAFGIVLLFLGWPMATLVKAIQTPETYFEL